MTNQSFWMILFVSYIYAVPTLMSQDSGKATPNLCGEVVSVVYPESLLSKTGGPRG